MEKTVARARAVLKAFHVGGVDSILFSNESSLPYDRQMSFVTRACTAQVIGELVNEICVPFGGTWRILPNSPSLRLIRMGFASSAPGLQQLFWYKKD